MPATAAGCGSRSAACRASMPRNASSATTAWAATSPRASRPSGCCCATTRSCSVPWPERTHDLQQVNLDLDAFARQLAHELRTPIGHVQGLAQLLDERGGERLNDRGPAAARPAGAGCAPHARHRGRADGAGALDAATDAAAGAGLERARARGGGRAAARCTRQAPLRWDIQCDMRVHGQPGGAEDRARQPDGQRREVHA